MPILVIDLCEDRVNGAVFSGKSFELLASASVRTGPGEAGVGAGLAAPLRELLEGLGKGPQVEAAGPGGDAPADYSKVFGDVYLGLSPGLVSLRVLKLPFTDRLRIREVLGYELQGLLPYDVGEAVADGISLKDGRVLAVAVEKRTLAEYLGALRSVGLDPVWAGLSQLLIPAFLEATLKPEGTAAFVSTDFISVEQGGGGVFFNPFGDLAGLRLSLGYLDADGVGVDTFYCVEETDEALRGLLGQGARIERLSLPGGAPGRLAACFALAWAIRQGRLNETIDLRTGEFEYTERRLKARRRLRLTAVLACLIAVLLIADTYVRYLEYSGVLKAYESALGAEYLKLFPGERGRVEATDPVYLLNAKLKALDREARVVGGGVRALGLLNGLSAAAAAAPEMQIRLSDVTAADGRLSARGQGASFEAANRFKELVEADPAFKDVLLSEVKAAPKGGVSFSLSAGI